MNNEAEHDAKHTGTIMYFLHEHHLKIKQLQSTRVTKELGQCCYFETVVALVWSPNMACKEPSSYEYLSHSQLEC